MSGHVLQISGKISRAAAWVKSSLHTGIIAARPTLLAVWGSSVRRIHCGVNPSPCSKPWATGIPRRPRTARRPAPPRRTPVAGCKLQLETGLYRVERGTQMFDVVGNMLCTPGIPLRASRVVLGKINIDRVEAGNRLEPGARLVSQVHVVVVEAYPIDDDAVDIVVTRNLLDEKPLIVARRTIERIEEEFLAVPASVGKNAPFFEGTHLPVRMGNSGYLVVKLRHPGANFYAMLVRLPNGLAKRIECAVSRRTRCNPTGVKDESGRDLVVFILFGGKVNRANAVLRGYGNEGCDVRPAAQVDDGADYDLSLERHARRRRYR